jgi:hypothetical protein
LYDIKFMSCRTLPGTDIFFQDDRTVAGDPFSERSVDGRFIGFAIGLQGTQPTYTEFTTVSSGTYKTPEGCLYIEVYLVGAGGGGAAGQTSTSFRNGGGGGAGGVAVGFFEAGTYAYDINIGGTAAVLSAGGPGSACTFGPLIAGGGGGGLLSTGGFSPAAASGTTTNSIYPTGCTAATPPGLLGGNGGGNFIKGYTGRASVSNTTVVDGVSSVTGGGGSGGCGATFGGIGGNGYLLIIEYY